MANTKHLQVLFLIEIRCGSKKVGFIRNKIGFENSFMVNNKGWSRGLARFWRF